MITIEPARRRLPCGEPAFEGRQVVFRIRRSFVAVHPGSSLFLQAGKTSLVTAVGRAHRTAPKLAIFFKSQSAPQACHDGFARLAVEVGQKLRGTRGVNVVIGDVEPRRGIDGFGIGRSGFAATSTAGLTCRRDCAVADDRYSHGTTRSGTTLCRASAMNAS